MNIKKPPSISVVVIGLNEASNLNACMQAILNSNYPNDKIELIYVDSGSIDRSADIAQKYTDKVFIEKSFYSTAARGRNRGLIEASNEIIHFIDGDMEIGSHYLNNAVEKLVENDEVAAVFGYIEEKDVNNNFLNYLFDSNLSKKNEGFVFETKAGGTYKRNLLLKLDGYDERIKLGEETELGERIIKTGNKIFQINELMGTHDYDFRGIRSLVKLYLKMGESLVIQSLLYENGDYWKNTMKKNYNNLIQNIFLIIMIFLSFISNKFYILFATIILFLLWQFFKLLRRKDFNKTTILYYLIMNLMKPITFWGQIKTYSKILFVAIYRTNLIVPKMKLS